MDRIEELVGDEGGQPEPRRRLVLGLLGFGLLTTALGMACTAAPGGMIVLGAWLAVEKEMDRVESGYLPSDVAPEVRRLRALVLAGVATVMALFVVQWILLRMGFYDALWSAALASALGA